MRSESLGVVALLAACAPKGAGTAHPSPNAAPVTAIVNATVIPMDTERLIRNAAVVIRGDRIVWVGPGSPFDAIATATRNAGEFMGGDRFGTIVPGARADLIVIADDPLADVARLREPRAVMARGRWVTSP